MSTLRTKWDVIVVGGGPAGSTAATLLAREGYDVVVFEKEKFPRDHVGESMLPFCYRMFESLGVLDQLKKSFVRKPGVRFIDRNGNGSTSWCFRDVIADETYLSFQVNRAEFDDILLRNTRHNGAEVREQVTVRDVDISDAGRVVVRTVDSSGEQQSHEARFLIDASGRDAVVGTKNGWRTARAELDRTALWSHWTGVKLAGGLEEGLSIICYVGEEKKGWIWVFPLSEDRITAGVVMQNSYIRDERRRLEASGSTDWRLDLCVQELNVSPFVQSLLAGAERALPVQVNGNYSYEVKNHFGPNYAMIGDARGFIDPIFSSGVFLSIKTAHLVSAAVHQQLSGKVGSDNPDMVQAYRTVTGAYDFVHRMIRLFYNPHAITWAEIGADGQSHKRHESAWGAGHFMLAGDFFENAERYSTFFENLEDPAKFRLYKMVVIDRTGPIDNSCHTPHEISFGELEHASPGSG